MFQKIRNFFVKIRRAYREIRLKLYVRANTPKTVAIRNINEKKLQALGRDVGGTYMQAIRHKKSGRVVMFPGSADQIKARFGDDYEIVESIIKE
jgi:hypothetical protein